MPHLTSLQERRAPDGVTVLAIARSDPDGTRQQTLALLEAIPEAMRFAVAWDPEGAIWSAYMDGSGTVGIPAAFVVDGSGRLAWIGPPAFAEVAVNRVLAGTWDPATGPAEVGAIAAEFTSLSRSAGARPRGAAVERMLERIAEFSAACPELAQALAEAEYHLLQDSGQAEGAREKGRMLAAYWTACGDKTALNSLAWGILQQKEGADLELARVAAQAAANLCRRRDPHVMDTLAAAHWRLGDRKSAIEAQQAALTAAIADPQSSARLRDQFRARLAEYEGAAP